MEIEALRRAYAAAIESNREAESLLNKLLQEDTGSALELAYMGATEALQAKHHRNPFRKLQFVKQAQEILSQAVVLDPQQVEIRYLRFSIQHHLPSFLKVQDHWKEDKDMMLRHLLSYGNNPGLCITIGQFLIKSGRCSPQEVERIRDILKELPQ
jgi:hypothetical protein